VCALRVSRCVSLCDRQNMGTSSTDFLCAHIYHTPPPHISQLYTTHIPTPTHFLITNETYTNIFTVPPFCFSSWRDSIVLSRLAWEVSHVFKAAKDSAAFCLSSCDARQAPSKTNISHCVLIFMCQVTPIYHIVFRSSCRSPP